MLEKTAVKIAGRREPVITATPMVPNVSKYKRNPNLYIIYEISAFTAIPQIEIISRLERTDNFVFSASVYDFKKNASHN